MGTYKRGLGFVGFIGLIGFIGSWVVISGVRSRVSIGMTHLGGFIFLLIAAHEPPSSWGAPSQDPKLETQ